MRYGELRIETQRQAPARARSEGEAFLGRGGYVRADGELTALGRRAHARLAELSQRHPPVELFRLAELPATPAEDGSFFFLVETGQEDLLQCPGCGYAAPRQLARSGKPSPMREEPGPLEKVPTPECHTIEALARFLDIPKQRTAKALMYTRSSDGKFVFVVVRGDTQASEAKLRQTLGELRAATTEEIIGAGAAPGYASPIGLRDALVVVDDLVPASANLVAGANEPGYHLLNTNYGRDYSALIVTDIALSEPGAPCPNCGKPLALVHANVLWDAAGYQVRNILGAIAETHHDEKGLMLPPAVSPFAVYLLHLPGKELDTPGKARELHDAWESAGIPILYDDRDERAGVKFADADLIGCPVRATIGERGLKDGMVELKPRRQSEIVLVPFADALRAIDSLMKAAP